MECEITGIVGIYSDPRHVIHYTSNDEVRQKFAILPTGHPTGGRATPSDESPEVRWVQSTEISNLQMDRSMRIRLGHHLERRNTPVVA
jgi:hypothetical protein